MTLKEHHDKKIPITIDQSLRTGLCTIERVVYFRYNQVFEAYRQKGLSKNQSYLFASDECGCSETTIRKAVIFVNQEVL